MTVGELFINIGLKGAAQVGQALGGVSKWMNELTSTSLETKAAIVGVVYGIEHFMSRSAELGMSLQQFSNYTGLSIDSLQRWQVAGRMAGVSAEEMESSIKGVQKAIAEMQLGQGPPGGFAMISRYAGGIDIRKLNDTFYVLNKIKKFAQNPNVPRPFANYFMSQAHMSDNMIQFLRTTQTDMSKINPKLIASDDQVHQLAKISVAWDMLHLKIQRVMDRFTAKHGLPIIDAIAKVADVLSTTVENVIKLVDHFKVLQYVAVAAGLAIAGAFSPITVTIAAIVAGLSEIQKFREGKSNIFQSVPEKASQRLEETGGISGIFDRLKNHKMDMMESSFGDIFKAFASAGNMVAKAVGVPQKIMEGNSAPSINQTFNITHYGDAKDTHAVKQVHGQAANHAAREASRILRNNPASLRAN